MRKRKSGLPNVMSLAYHVEQMQQGGVYTPGVMPYEVVPGQMPGLNIPQPHVQNAIDGAQLAYRREALNQRQQALDDRKQQQDDRTLASEQASFIDLEDKLFGKYHNPYQEQQLQAIRKQHNIPENITSDIFQNPFRLKDMEYNMTQALISPEFKRVMGEVGTVDKMRESAAKTLTQDEYREWAKAYDTYQFSTDGKYDTNNLAPSKYQIEKAAKETDYASWLDSSANRDYLAGVDPTKQASLDQYYDDLAGEFVAKGAKEAMDRGYIEYIDPANPDAGVILTKKGKDLALDKAEKAKFIKEGRYDEYVKKRRLGQTISQENRKYSDTLTDQNRVDAANAAGNGAGKPSPGHKETVTEKSARLELEKIQNNYVDPIDPNEKLPSGVTIRDRMWQGVQKKETPAAIKEVNDYLKSKGAKSKTPDTQPPQNILFPAGTPGGGLSPAQQLIQGSKQ